MTRELSTTKAQAEQQRRMKAVSLDNQPSDAEILRKMALAGVRRERRVFSSRLVFVPVVGGMLAGLLLGGSALAVAAHAGYVQVSFDVLGELMGRQDASRDAPPAHGKRGKTKDQAPREAVPASRSDENQVGQAEAKAVPPSERPTRIEAEVQVAERQDSDAVARPLWQSGQELESDKISHDIGAMSQQMPSPGEAEQRALWRKVADSLREGDEGVALMELRRLERDDDPAGRDAAALLRLQIRSKTHGLSTQELNELVLLRDAGASSSVRASARRLYDKVLTQRSTGN